MIKNTSRVNLKDNTIRFKLDERLFLIEMQGRRDENYFCNLSHIPTILTKVLKPGDTFVIKHFWNRKFMKCGAFELNEMFKANGIDFKI